MVAMKSSELAAALRSASGKLDVFLMHRTDAGEVADLAASTAKALSASAKPPGEILRLTDQDLAQTPGRLATEARMFAMFGGRPVIVVKQAPQLTPALIEDLLEGPELSAYIVIEGGNLKKDAKLRQLVEKAKRGVAVACYGDDERSLPQLIRSEVQAAGMTITPDAVQLLTQLLGADRALSRAELAKLILYTGSDKQIGIEHVEAIVGDAAAQAFDTALNATLAGDVASALTQIDRLAGSGTPPSVFLIMLLSNLQRLSGLAASAERGESIEAAIGRMRPPLHFRQKDVVKGQLSRWRVAEIAAALAATQETVRQSRLNPALESELACELVIRFSRLNPRLTKTASREMRQ
jgi:DNA polymerase III subunit delta